MLKHDTLRYELQNDPLQIGYANMTAEQITASLNNKVVQVYDPVPVESVKAWAVKQTTPGGQFLLKALKLAALDDTHPASGLADIILEAVGMNMPVWRMDDQANVSLMQAAVQAGFLSADQITQLQAIGQKQISRAEQLNIDNVLLGDVLGALNNGN